MLRSPECTKPTDPAPGTFHSTGGGTINHEHRVGTNHCVDLKKKRARKEEEPEQGRETRGAGVGGGPWRYSVPGDLTGRT